MKRAVTALATVLLTLTLAGCEAPTGATERIRDNSVFEKTAELSDGRTVTCVAMKLGYAGGLSCDWGGAK